MTENTNGVPSGKKSVERSASYPGVTIQDTLTFVGIISKSFTPQHTITRDDISAVTKVKTVHRITAAAVQYGLLILSKGGYKISQLYRDYLNPVTSDEKRNHLLTFFKSPKLYSDLIEKYNDHVIPAEFKSVLIRFHKIAPNAAEEVATIFIENARFVGVLNDSDILNMEFTSSLEKEIVETNKGKQDTLPNKSEPPEPVFKVHEFQVSHEDTKIVLTENKYCFIKYPKNINDKDILILRKWIELLELTM